MRRVLAGVALLMTAVSSAAAAPTDADVDAIARQLRCVVCQTLSVADSPSEMARQMRDVIRERLAAGDTPEAVLAYFASRYGEWVLLVPPARGFSLVAWAAPLVALVGGLGVAAAVLRRWAARGTAGVTDDGAVPDDDALAAVRAAVERRRS
ncbi:MAG: cytochrome c-type biogenesis protein CcmH [Candidatus Rokubacteria bacterium]|nr:cytochrome c-type biogenesis protein CcmH [Candidatus Rokubacteria bacterium]